MKIGYIGLGALGGQLARRFHREHQLCVWDVNQQACAAFQAEGISVANSAADLARRSEVILICLPRSSDVRQVIFGAEGLAEGLTAGQLVIDQTSGVPQETISMALELAQLGVDMLDAAVSASPHIVAQGGTTLMVAGPAGIVERALPVLRAITQTILVCGSRVGDGQAMKMVNNAINGAIRMGTLELTALGRKAGLSLKDLSSSLNAGLAHNQTTDKMLPALLEGKTSTDFALSLMLKDLNQAISFGMEQGVPMPVSAITRGLLQIGLTSVGERARLEDMVGVIESMANIRIAGPVDASTDVHDGTMSLIDSAIAALCRAVTLESVAAGFKYGLSLQIMRDILFRSSGWSVAGRALMPALAGDQPEPTEPLAPLVDRLQQTTELAAKNGAPVLLFTAVRTLYEATLARYGDKADNTKITALCEEFSGIRFAAV
jgi:3-hydroxyisobutyrate dehydrogenase